MGQTSHSQEDHNCMIRISDAFKLDIRFVFNTMAETIQKGIMTFDDLENALMKVITIIKTDEQFKAICDFLAHSTKMGIDMVTSTNSFIKVVSEPIEIFDIKVAKESLHAVLEQIKKEKTND